MELREIYKGKKHLRYSSPLQNSPIISKITSINQFASILEKEKTLRCNLHKQRNKQSYLLYSALFITEKILP